MFVFDRQNFSKRSYTDEGYLVAPARLARTGVQDYYAYQMGLTDRDPMDIVRVYRPENEVFNDESMKSFKAKPVTDNHPDKMLNAAIAKEHIVGYVTGDIARDGMHLVSEITVIDASMIKKIELGKVEISNGYYCETEFKSGETDSGEKYDAIQTNIRGNHVAIVERGRCGPSCRVSDEDKPEPKPKENTMIIKINGVDYEVSDQAGQAMNQVIAQHDSLTEQLDELKRGQTDAVSAIKDEHKSEMDELQAKYDDAVSKVPTAEALDEMVDARTAVVGKARSVIDGFEHKGKTCDQIRKEVVAAQCADVDIDKVSDEYIRARFDALSAGQANSMDTAIAGAFDEDKTNDENKDVVTDAREKFKERQRNAWKGGKQ